MTVILKRVILMRNTGEEITIVVVAVQVVRVGVTTAIVIIIMEEIK